jgi:uncharacterized protein (UPF0332 family)
MNGFLEKTQQNLNSAEILLKQSHYASSVHCAFYACLQMLLHVLFVKLKHDKTRFINDIQRKKTGTHAHAFSLIEDEMRKARHPDIKWLRKNFNKLKDLRIKADYKEEYVSQPEGYEALNKANAINNVINKLS